MRRKLLRVSGWLQFAVMIANLIPMFYGWVFPPQALFGETLYVKSLLIIFPLGATDFAIRKTKTLWGYLLCSALIIAVTGIAAGLLGPVISRDSRLWAYVVILVIETFLIETNRYSARMRRNEEYEIMLARQSESENVTYNRFLQEGHGMFDKPHKQFLCVFPFVYAIGWLLPNRALCDIALLSAGGYLILFGLYTYLDKTEEYLSMHQRVAGVPRKRIYGIGRMMFLVFLVVMLVGMLPGILTANYRSYQDLRGWMDNLQFDDMEDTDGEEKWTPEKKKKSDLGLFYRLEPPEWLNDLIYVVGTGCGVLLLYFMVKAVQQAFTIFRAGGDENGDIIENLTDAPEEEITFVGGRRKRADRETESVRRKYRRTIRRHRKDMPNPAESPSEIEQKAGLSEDETMRELHEQYERERYGKRE